MQTECLLENDIKRSGILALAIIKNEKQFYDHLKIIKIINYKNLRKISTNNRLDITLTR